MGESVFLQILTPHGSAIESKVEEVTVPGRDGEFGVLPSHTPYLAIVDAGILSYRKDGRKENLALRGGFAEVNEDRVVILSEEVYLPQDIDLEDLSSKEKDISTSLEEAMNRGEETDDLLEEAEFINTLKSIAGDFNKKP